ncbi:MAG: internal scaffolding protein [Microviridae sp.]|nr:MAG: internal scaffolding protein [Microviridae sp.]
MATHDNSTIGQRSGQNLQGSNEPQLRNENGVHGQSINGDPGGIDPTALQSYIDSQNSEREREENDRISLGQTYAQQSFGCNARNSESAKVFASFDENNYDPQPAEFYDYGSQELDSYGYF